MGEIKALAMPMNVFASALSPAVMGILIDLHFQLDDIILMLASLSLFSTIASFLWFNLLGQTKLTNKLLN